MAWNNAWYNAPCAFWPTKTLKPVNVANSGLPPVLLFQATNDPYQGGVTVHRLLKHSSLVVEQGGGNHGITLSGNTCLDKYLAKYLTDGTVPQPEQRRGRPVCTGRPPSSYPWKRLQLLDHVVDALRQGLDVRRVDAALVLARPVDLGEVGGSF